MIFQSLQWLLIFYFWKLLSQFSKFDAKGIKMIRMTKEIDLAQLVLCVSIGGPNMDFYLVLVRHVVQLHVTQQKQGLLLLTMVTYFILYDCNQY